MDNLGTNSIPELTITVDSTLLLERWEDCQPFPFFNFLWQAMDRFRGSKDCVLVATDVAARGLDVPGIRTVVHYQLPHSAEVHRHL